MGMSIYITREIPPEGAERLRAAGHRVEVNPEDRDLSREELAKAVRGHDGILCMLTNRIDREFIQASPQIRICANYAVGFNNFDLAAATEAGVALTNTPGVLTDATADLAWALLFSAARRIVEADRFVREGRFQGWAPKLFPGADITGRTLGIVGAGRIGTAMALRSRGFEMRVLYAGRKENPLLNRELGARWVDLNTLLEQSDFISLHVPLTEETRGLIGEAELARMKPTALLINTARGPVIDEAALVQALRERRIAGAGLDVFEEEPKLAEGLTELDNVVVLPHIGSATHETRRRMAIMAAENLIAWFAGKRPANLLNEEVWKERG